MLPLSEFFGSVERLAGELYAYRFALGGLAVLLAAAAGLALYRTGLARAARDWAQMHRGVSAVLIVAVLVVLIPLGNYTLSPLWTRSTLEEASPLEISAGSLVATPHLMPAEGPAPLSEVSELRVLSEGVLAGADAFHFGRGRVLLLEVGHGSRVLRLEGLSVRNGPDLFVYLSTSAQSVAGALNLGALKATDGSFSYDVPVGAADTLDYALIWCRQFGVLFASARLVLAS